LQNFNTKTLQNPAKQFSIKFPSLNQPHLNSAHCFQNTNKQKVAGGKTLLAFTEIDKHSVSQQHLRTQKAATSNVYYKKWRQIIVGDGDFPVFLFELN
jgi:hypothetical protein